jgi:hypothetical protein
MLVVPDDLRVQSLPRKDFLQYAVELAGEPYQAYGTLGS